VLKIDNRIVPAAAESDSDEDYENDF